MADDHAEETRRALSPWESDPGSGPGPLSAIHDLVMADAVAWRAEMPFNDGQAKRRLLALLAQNPAAADAAAGTAFDHDEMAGKSAPSDHVSVPAVSAAPVEREPNMAGGTEHPEGLNRPMPGEPVASKSAASRSVRWTSGRTRVWAIAAAGLAAAVVLAFLFGVRPWLGTTPNTGPLLPPPVLLHWSSAAADGSTSAEQAFARGATLTPCELENPSISAAVSGKGVVAASTLDTIWLENGPNYGIALIQFACPVGTREHGQSKFWLVSLGKHPRWGWQPLAGEYTPRPASSGTPGPQLPTVAVPAWLALPADTYTGYPVPPCGQIPPVAWQDWYSAIRTFVAGHVADRALRPADAQPVTIDGTLGWMVQEHGIASVVVPLADGTTFFFAGSVTSTQVQSLAGQALAHLSALLPAVYRGMPFSDCN
jgi:hypothetical protein